MELKYSSIKVFRGDNSDWEWASWMPDGAYNYYSPNIAFEIVISLDARYGLFAESRQEVVRRNPNFAAESEDSWVRVGEY